MCGEHRFYDRERAWFHEDVNVILKKFEERILLPKAMSAAEPMIAYCWSVNNVAIRFVANGNFDAIFYLRKVLWHIHVHRAFYKKFKASQIENRKDSLCER